MSAPISTWECHRPVRSCRPILHIALLLVIVANPSLGHADWAVAGAQYSCDRAARFFEVRPYNQSSDPSSSDALVLGFKGAPEGSTTVVCPLTHHVLKVVIDIYPPQSHGSGMGAGRASVSSASIHDVELAVGDLSFTVGPLIGQEELLRYRITDKGKSILTAACYGKPGENWRPGPERCENVETDVDAEVAARAAATPKLADVAIQEGHSATKLPKQNDLALAFDNPLGSAVPLCAHLQPAHLYAQVPGYIAGSAGERIYIHPINPQICNAAEDSGCKPHAYLVPGDRINVVMICGSWASVEYPSMTRAKPSVYGWVPTEKLYNVKPIIVEWPGVWAWYRKSLISYPNPLLAAVVNQDAQKVREILASGNADLNTPLGHQSPLSFAVADEDDAIVSLLLNAGVKVDELSASLGLTSSRTIWNRLVMAGMDVSKVRTAFPRLAETDRIDRAMSDLGATGRWAPVRDLPAKVMDKVGSGIRVDQPDENNRTALILAIGSNNVDVVQALLRAGANPNRLTDDLPPLFNAIGVYGDQNGYHDPTSVELLIRAGADVNFKSSGDNSPNGEFPSTCCGSQGQTVLTYAAENAGLPIVRALLEHGADPSVRRSDGMSAAHIAAQKKNAAVAALITHYESTRAPQARAR